MRFKLKDKISAHANGCPGSCVSPQGFIFNFSVGGGMVPPLRGGTTSIGGGMARDAFGTFNNSKFKPYNSFKVNCVG